MKNKILVLGGGGFIGLHLSRHLAKNSDNHITIADNFYFGNYDSEVDEVVKLTNVLLIKEDFTKVSSYNKLEKSYDQVYMLASMVGVSTTLETPHEVIRVNTALIYNTLEWLAKTKSKRVLFTSTSECYSATTDYFDYPIPTDENVPLCIEEIGHPRFTYAVTKMLGESGFLNYAKYYNFDSVIIRYNNIIGPRMGFKHVIPNIVERFIHGETPFKVYGAEQTRSFCYITDAIRSTELAMNSDQLSGQILHIGSDEEITIENLVKYTGQLLEYDGEYEKAATFPGSVNRRCPDISKLRDVLNYNPGVSWKEAVLQTVEWYADYYKRPI